jgi:hypothetical protein
MSWSRRSAASSKKSTDGIDPREHKGGLHGPPFCCCTLSPIFIAYRIADRARGLEHVQRS